MPDLMMQCGCRANSTFKNAPFCAIHMVDAVAAQPPDLTGRKAECAYCWKEADSSLSLAFFEYKGAGSLHASRTCKNCRFYEEAHIHDPNRVDPRSRIEMGECTAFEPIGARGKDTYYCGCMGWD